MSDFAFREYEGAWQAQVDQNEARRIRSKVKDAQDNPHDAGARWPFELLQNACDGGPRLGRNTVEVLLASDGDTVVFEHDGAPFSSQELAALLSGGSSKDFESTETTGRFGTGFLVTHVLSPRTSINGLLRTSAGVERFELILDRSGDEESILGNIVRSREAIRVAAPLDTIEQEPSAHFEYRIGEENPLLLGVEVMRESLPYMFATCPQLGRMVLQLRNAGREIWQGLELREYPWDGTVVRDRYLRVEREGESTTEYRAIAVARGGSGARVLLLLKRRDSTWEVSVPSEECPRMFRRFPIRMAHALALNVILDADFDVDSDRRRVSLNEVNKTLIVAALDAIPLACRLATEEGWVNPHLVSRVGPPGAAFTQDSQERKWWLRALADIARKLSEMPLVQTPEGMLPADPSKGRHVVMVVPALAAEALEAEADPYQMLSLVSATKDFVPPLPEVANDWAKIFQEWHALGVKVSRVSLEILASRLRKEARSLDDLTVGDKPLNWVSEFVELVGQCWKHRKGVNVAILDRLLPDQHGRLRSSSELKVDAGIARSLKQIASSIGIDVASKLLHLGLGEAATALNLEHVEYVISQAVPNSMTSEDVVGECLKRLNEQLQEGMRVEAQQRPVIAGGVKMFAHLWETNPQQGAMVAKQFPLLAADGTIVKWGPKNMMMAPVSVWHEAAQAFWEAYPPWRVLSDLYCGDDDLPNLVPALIAWEVAIPDPLCRDAPKELKDVRLAALAEKGQDTTGVLVSGEPFSQIALLQPEVINRCQEEKDTARALLGLVLCYVARQDPSWRRTRVVRGQKGRDQVEIRVREALWLADLTTKAWVPVSGEDGKPGKALANAATLKDLLDSAWLADNKDGTDLLSEFFGFDALEVLILGASREAWVRNELRNQLAALVRAVGTDPASYAGLISELSTRAKLHRDFERCRRLGLAIQAAVGQALERPGIKDVKLIDRGFDYQVTLDMAEMADLAFGFEVGPYLVEVKATTNGTVSLTPFQAEKAATTPTRYVLCVVDLRGVSPERLDMDWTKDDIEPLAFFVDEIGTRVADTWDLVQEARTRRVGIRNETALRYTVPPEVWEGGVHVAEWVERITR